MRCTVASLCIVAFVFAADEPSFDRTLSQEDLFALASIGGVRPTSASPLAGSGIEPAEGTYDDAAVGRLRDAGILDVEGRLTDRGRSVWEAIMRPDISLRIRRVSKEGVAGMAYVGAGEELWGFAPLAAGDARLFGPFPLADFTKVVAHRVALPVPGRDAGLEASFSVDAVLVLAALDAARRRDIDPPAAREEAIGSTQEEVAAEALAPSRMAILEQDASIDAVDLITRLAPGRLLEGTLDALVDGEWVVAERGASGTRYRLSPRGDSLADAWLHPGESLRVTCATSSGAATAQFCSSHEGLVVVRYSPSTRSFDVASFVQGDPSARYAETMDELVRDARAAPPPTPQASRAGDRRLGDEVASELARGSFRAAPVLSRREVWRRGRPDVTAIDADGDKRADIEYEDTDGDDAPDLVRVRDFAEGPFTRSFILRDGKWEESNILEAHLEVSFALPWDRSAYHPHDVDVILNGKVIGRITQAVPEGLYRFPVRPLDLKVDADAPSENEVRLETSHLRGGHYVVSSGFNLVIRLAQVSRYVVAESTEEAERILRERAGLVASGVDPAVYVNEWRADPPVPEAGKETRVRGRVHNQGMEAARGVVVRWFDGEPSAEAKPFAEKTIEVVEPGGPVDVEAVWMAAAGDHRIVVTVSLPEGEKELKAENDRVALTVRTGGDKEGPSLAIAEPLEGARVAAGRLVVRGSAADDVGVDSIEVSIDGGLWQRVEPAERWEASIDLAKGDHLIRMRVRDTSGRETEQARAVTVE